MSNILSPEQSDIVFAELGDINPMDFNFVQDEALEVEEEAMEVEEIAEKSSAEDEIIFNNLPGNNTVPER